MQALDCVQLQVDGEFELDISSKPCSMTDAGSSRSALAPRAIAGIGLVGGPLVFLSSCAVLPGVYSQVSVPAGVAALPPSTGR